MKITSLQNPKIFVEIPLTTQSSKVRVKARNSFYEYGLPVATRQTPFSQRHYIEWQIGYDADKNDSEKLDLTSLKESEFIGANGKRKALYELSEYLFYFAKWGIVSQNELDELLVFLKQVSESDFLDCCFQILRSHPVKREILGVDFYCSEVKYPLLVHKFGDFDILVEIIIKEKQRAVGVQPMLYVCFPITHLSPNKNKPALLGRKADLKECANLTLDEKDKAFVLEAFKIFGILSPSHNYDIRQILEWIRANSKGTQCSQNA